MNNFLTYMSSVQPLPEELIIRLREIITERAISRRECLVRAGHLSQHIYYLSNGLLHCFQLNDRKEVSSGFLKEGDLCLPAEYFFNYSYGLETIRAVEPSMVEAIPRQDLQTLYHDFPVFNTLGRMFAESYFRSQYRRLQAMWMQSARNRYLWLKEYSPWLLQRVPAKYLASYIGITQTMLSRIKGKN